MPKRALITGITGQGGSYLVDLLLEKGYQVSGIVRRCSTTNLSRIEHALPHLNLIQGDMTDPVSLDHAVRTTVPDLIFNMAAQSFVGESWRQPIFTHQVVAGGTLNLLESVRKYAPGVRFYQSSSSEMVGGQPPPQNELTPFYPKSPYGVAKISAHWSTINARESYGIFACCGINFNFESPRRGFEFVTRKISHAVAQIVKKKQERLYLGNLDAKRDWSHCKDNMEAAILMLEQDQPDDYVIGTGIAHSVQDFVQAAFDYVGLDWRNYVEIDKQFIRPAEVNHLLADPTKAREKLKWKPKVTFRQLVEEMVDYDLSH